MSFRLKVNLAHPTGSINMRDGAGRPLTVGQGSWITVDSISPSMELWRKYLIIEQVEGGQTERPAPAPLPAAPVAPPPVAPQAPAPQAAIPIPQAPVGKKLFPAGGRPGARKRGSK